MGKIILSPQAGRLGAMEHAKMYAALGWRVFPVYEIVPATVDTTTGEAAWRCSCEEGPACGRPGKHPRLAEGVNEASTDRVKIESWWTRWPNANIGIATGRPSGLTVVDADASEGKPGVINLTSLSAKFGGMPGTLIANTGGGGLHLYFTFTDKLPTGSNVIDKAIDVRNDGGYVIAPPSRHWSGKQYTWRSEAGELLGCPDWLSGAVGGAAAGAKQARGRKRQQPGFRIDKLESMLKSLDPDERDLWLNVGVIMGRLYIGTGLENDGWAVYEAWASKSAKFDADKAGNLARMREMYYERSQEAPRTGGQSLSIGSIISAAKTAGWTPFGDRKRISWEPGNEAEIADALVEALVEKKGNTFFNVMGEVRDVLKTQMPVLRLIAAATAKGEDLPETLIVRRTTIHSIMSVGSEVAVLEAPDKFGTPTAVPIPEKLATIIIRQKPAGFPVLTGISEWPMVASSGELIVGQTGYDPNTGLYFDIARDVKINEKLTSAAALDWLADELMADFPFEEDIDCAAAIGLLLAFMQRPLMKTCPGFGIVAPQAGTGKSTLVEVASLAVHGFPVASHAFPEDEDELRKAIHSLLLAKMPTVLFDNIKKGSNVDSDHLAKLLTSETSTDRTLGASETRKEVNTLLVTFTGNNIAFSHDMASRVITIRLNAKTSNPLVRKFRHKSVLEWAGDKRNEALSALVAIARAGVLAGEMEGNASRFSEFDERIAKPIFAVTGIDIRTKLHTAGDGDTEEDAEMRAALELLSKWQTGWRKNGENGQPWRTAEVISALDAKTFDDAGIKILQRAIGNQKLWESDLSSAIGRMLRLLNGDHKYEPLLLTSRMDSKHKVNKWFIIGVEPAPTSASVGPRSEGKSSF
jgi:hypothetical protein